MEGPREGSFGQNGLYEEISHPEELTYLDFSLSCCSWTGKTGQRTRTSLVWEAVTGERELICWVKRLLSKQKGPEFRKPVKSQAWHPMPTVTVRAGRGILEGLLPSLSSQAENSSQQRETLSQKGSAKEEDINIAL